jgi:hypothetical protein
MTMLQEYIDSVFSFEKNQSTAGFEERVGPPDELSAVIGRITMNFQYLENELKKRIIQMLELNQVKGHIIVSELTFKNLVNLFSSLYHNLKADYHFNGLPNFEDGYFKELLKALNKCEEMRNQILHSTIIKNWQTKEITRKKITSKAKVGLKITEENIDIPYLFDVADYIIAMSMEVEQFFIDFKRKTN